MYQNSNLKSLSEQINKLSFDVRAEVLIAHLKQLGVDIDQMRFDHIGSFYRPFRNDVSHSELDSSNNQLKLKLSRNGIYDMLPEGLSHQSNALESGQKETINTLVSSHKQQKKEEANARLFYAPIESHLLKYLVHLEEEERHLIGNHQSKFEAFLKHFWELDNKLSLKQCMFLLSIMPHISKLKGNLDEITKGLETHLNKKVSYKKSYQSLKVKNDSSASIKLGQNFVIGGLTDALPHIEFIIADVNDNEVADYLKDGSVYYFITEYLKYLLPIEFEFSISIEPNYSQNTKGFGILGHSSKLTNPIN